MQRFSFKEEMCCSVCITDAYSLLEYMGGGGSVMNSVCVVEVAGQWRSSLQDNVRDDNSTETTVCIT